MFPCVRRACGWVKGVRAFPYAERRARVLKNVRVFQKRTRTYGIVRKRTASYEIVRDRTSWYEFVRERTETYKTLFAVS